MKRKGEIIMTELNGLGNFFNSIKAEIKKMDKDGDGKISAAETAYYLRERNSGASLTDVDPAVLTDKNKARLSQLKGETPKTEFASKKEFLEFFGLNPENDDFAEKLAEAQAYMKDNGIKIVKIGGEDFNVIIAEGQKTRGTKCNDLVLSTLDNNSITTGNGDDFIIASGKSKIGAGLGDDTILANNSKIATGAGKDFVWGTGEENISDLEIPLDFCLPSYNSDEHDSIIDENLGNTSPKNGKTEFLSKQEFLDFFQLDPNSPDFADKIKAAEDYMKENNISKVTIGGELFEIYTDDDVVRDNRTYPPGQDYSNIYKGDSKTNCLFLSTEANNLTTGEGNDFIIASNADYIYARSGDDTIVAQNSCQIDGGTGDDTISYSATADWEGWQGAFGMVKHTYLYGGDGNDTIYADLGNVSGYIYGSDGDQIFVSNNGPDDQFNKNAVSDAQFFTENDSTIGVSGAYTGVNYDFHNDYSELDTNHDGEVSPEEYYARLNEELGPQNS